MPEELGLPGANLREFLEWFLAHKDQVGRILQWADDNKANAAVIMAFFAGLIGPPKLPAGRDSAGA